MKRRKVSMKDGLVTDHLKHVEEKHVQILAYYFLTQILAYYLKKTNKRQTVIVLKSFSMKSVALAEMDDV